MIESVGGISLNVATFTEPFKLAKRSAQQDSTALNNDATAASKRQFSAAASAAQSKIAPEPATPTLASQPLKPAADILLYRLFKQLLANRLGLDHGKVDEIKQRIEQLEAKKQQLLEAETSQLEQRMNQVKQLEAEISELRKMLEQLNKDAVARMVGDPLQNNSIAVSSQEPAPQMEVPIKTTQ